MSRTRLAVWATLYALLAFYASVVVSPLGFAPKDLSLDAAVRIFLDTTYAHLGSDQRADWTANLLMLVPLSALLTLALSRSSGIVNRIEAAITAFVLCAFFVIATKFAQVFFPRTVTLNYILAQLIGAACGVSLGAACQPWLGRLNATLSRRGPESLAVLLALVSVVLLAFMLVPFDVVLSPSDLRDRLAALPTLLVQVPGAGRPTPIRLILLCVGIAAVTPIGMLLALVQPRRGLVTIALQAVALMTLITAGACLVMSAEPSLFNIPLRAFGILAGAVALRWLARQDLARIRRPLAWLGLILPIPYLLALIVANGLATPHWRTPAEAFAAVDHRFFLPLWTDYIVTKAQAIRSVLSQLAMYAPIGVMFWMRGYSGRGAGWLAALLAAVLSTAVELARWLKPGLALDINNPAFAAIAAASAVAVMPMLWDILRSLTRISPEAQATAIRAPRSPLRPIIAAAILIVALACAAALLIRYPLGPLWLLPPLLATAGLTWWRPAAFLVLLPCIIPSLQLTPWTGWMTFSESDPFVLVTVAVLALRALPRAADLRLSPATATLLALFLACTAISIAIGLTVPEPQAGTSDIYMSAANGLRLAKPLLIAFLLLPFAAARQRTHADAARLFAFGMTAGLCVVSCLVVLERLTFSSLLAFTSEYRVMGPFASMHVGGGHIGAYLALAIPFSVVLLIRPRPWMLAAFPVVITLAGYAIVVTFARTAYAAAFAGVAVTALALVLGTSLSWRRILTALVLIATIGGSLAVATLASGFMADRVAATVGDFAIRKANWRQGLALQSATVAHEVFGMGTGTFLRLLDTAKRTDQLPSDFHVQGAPGDQHLALRSGVPLYFGQKVSLRPGETATLTLKARSDTPQSLGISLCEKLLLYSMNCTGHSFATGPNWASFTTPIALSQESPEPEFPWLHRPVELSLAGPSGSVIEFTDVTLTNAQGQNLIANGNFAEGTQRWYFTADNHIGWRILDQYLMTLLENGIAGLLTLVAIFVAAGLAAIRALRQGTIIAAATLGAIAATLVSFLSDATLESLTLATIIALAIGIAFVTNNAAQKSMEGAMRFGIAPINPNKANEPKPKTQTHL